MEFCYEYGGAVHDVLAEREGDAYRLVVDEQTYLVRIVRAARDEIVLQLDGHTVRAYVVSDGPRWWVAAEGRTIVLSKLSPALRRSARQLTEGTLAAAMPGQVRSVLVVEGQEVAAGETLVILEAMKMELLVTAPHAGRVREVCVRVGDVVDRGQRLLELAAPADAEGSK